MKHPLHTMMYYELKYASSDIYIVNNLNNIMFKLLDLRIILKLPSFILRPYVKSYTSTCVFSQYNMPLVHFGTHMYMNVSKHTSGYEAIMVMTRRECSS